MLDKHIDFFETVLVEQQMRAFRARSAYRARAVPQCVLRRPQTRDAAAFFQFFNNVSHICLPSLRWL
jgi:hypothetical protein